MIPNKEISQRIELEFDEFYTQIGKFNKISELPEEIDLKMSPFIKILLPFLLIGTGVIMAINLMVKQNTLLGIGIISISVLVYLLIYFTQHKRWDKQYVISRIGITVDHETFLWEKIDDLHLLATPANRGYSYAIRFTHDGNLKTFELDSMTRSVDEIKQLLYMYQRCWIIENSREN